MRRWDRCELVRMLRRIESRCDCAEEFIIAVEVVDACEPRCIAFHVSGLGTYRGARVIVQWLQRGEEAEMATTGAFPRHHERDVVRPER